MGISSAPTDFLKLLQHQPLANPTEIIKEEVWTAGVMLVPSVFFFLGAFVMNCDSLDDDASSVI